ncbi:hypothetical protein P171DRAFT_489558 [Karstenula rhodostoma CBS 690.94]|uniref:Uncharacterized protein n=1 Tax=Karstenula rhodostoma CBS 690.94 TaxID=1392251 RepID=A0A9P4PAC2_9PLEO|nr:hypothetical protein P171DRAFT_489558 [Karstenula rhodostoma CBS 690.94]
MSTVKLASGHDMPLLHKRSLSQFKPSKPVIGFLMVHTTTKTRKRQKYATTGHKVGASALAHPESFRHFSTRTKIFDPEVKRYPGWWMEDGKMVKPAKISIRKTCEQLEAAVNQGIAKSIIVSNSQAQLLYDAQTTQSTP